MHNCPTCGRLLLTPDGVPCPRCLAEEDAAVDAIDAFLDAGGSRTLGAVAYGTGLRMGLLRRLVRSGRIRLIDSATGVCPLCGHPVESGMRVCGPCAEKISGDKPAKAAGRPAPTLGFHSSPADDQIGRP